MASMLQTAGRHQLHANAYAKKWARFANDCVNHRVYHTVKRVQALATISESADTRQNHVIGIGDHIWIRGDSHSRFAHILKCLRGRPQISRTIVNYGYCHDFASSFLSVRGSPYKEPPSTPLVDGIALACRGSISIAWRRARARPL